MTFHDFTDEEKLAFCLGVHELGNVIAAVIEVATEPNGSADMLNCPLLKLKDSIPEFVRQVCNPPLPGESN